ncbi:MAG TPA: cobalamin-independent methionine synthase II family protein [Thermoleophilaceae bacterium]|nr:cobalamin-independent methionine synthase II family protein [Thermoleophilaceae bacterium]
MTIQTEPIGSIPRPPELLEAVSNGSGLSADELGRLQEAALRDTIERFEATGSPVITDGEQTKPSFATYPVDGVDGLAPDGVTIPFEDGHTRQLPRLTRGPFQFGTYADGYLAAAKAIAHVPVKQAVIAPSALSLLYPQDGIDGYPREAFLEDLTRESEQDIRRCLDTGAYKVQLDFTEGRLSIKLDPSKGILTDFVALINSVLDRFTPQERERIGIHTCPGGDQDSTHSLDVDYAELLPSLFQLHAGSFYIQLASEPDPDRVLGIIRDHAPADARIFAGVIDPIDPRVETPEEVRDRVLKAAEYIPVDRLGTCDDCGFSPFGDDTSTSRDTAFAKVAARVEGTAMAAERLGA